MNTLAVTGHRPSKLNSEYNCEYHAYGELQEQIYKALEAKVIQYEPKKIVTGVALGVDMIMATVAMRLDIPFTAAIPCIGQDSTWFPESKRYYKKILGHPLCTIHYVSDKPYDAVCMQNRNMWMVDQLTEPDDMLLSVWDGTTGGTYNCLKYAGNKLRKEQLVNINPNDLRKMIRESKNKPHGTGEQRG